LSEKTGMAAGRERRRYPRFSQNDIVRLTLLGEDGRAADARIIDASAGGVRIESPFELKPGSLVKVEWQDTLLLGEVLYTKTTGGSTTLGIELTRALYGMAELRRLNASLTNASQGTGNPRAETTEGEAVTVSSKALSRIP
jgi:hypothetical protein